jgi:hypothetical protein
LSPPDHPAVTAQTKSNRLVDRKALDDPDLIFKRDGGGFSRLDLVMTANLARRLILSMICYGNTTAVNNLLSHRLVFV